MKILIDTNVMLDFLTEREPYFEYVDKIMCLCKADAVSACIAAHSVMNAFYILRKEYSVEQRRQILLRYICMVSVCEINEGLIINALNRTDFKDVEDCLQDECAVSYGAEYIVTRNIDDFVNSRVKTVTPKKFLEIIDLENGQ